MSAGPARRARAAAAPRGRSRRAGPRRRDAPRRVRFAGRSAWEKAFVFGVCAALGSAEDGLPHGGAAARRAAALRELVEGALAR